MSEHTSSIPAETEGVGVSVDEAVGAEDWFFFLEIEVLDRSDDWSRDAFALYLLHCRGYHPKSAGSTFGEKGCRNRIGLTRKPWGTATEWLEKQGLIRTVVRGKHPVTLLSSAGARFTTSFRPIETDYRRHDGHRWEDLAEAGADVVKIPWRAMNIDRMNPGQQIGALMKVESLRLLVWAYSIADDDGWVSSDLLWLDDSAGSVVGRLRQDVSDRLHLQAGEVIGAVAELLGCGLLRHSECDSKGRGVLYLTHPMELPQMEREGREKDAA